MLRRIMCWLGFHAPWVTDSQWMTRCGECGIVLFVTGAGAP